MVLLFVTNSTFAQSGQKWSANLNAIAQGDALGTSNNQALLIMVNNALALQIKPGGSVLLNSLTNNGNGIVTYDNTGKLIPAIFPNDATKVLLGNGTWGSIPIPQNYWQLNNQDLFTITPGNVGIGTNQPLFKLDVIGDVRISENLYVGGGIIITDKVNAASEVNTNKINALLELKSAALRVDSIIMDSTKAIYGQANFTDDVKLANKLRVDGDVQINGNFKTAGSLTFAGDKVISYQPTTGGFGNYCFGTPPSPQAEPCFFPNTNNLIVQGTFYSWGHRNWDSQQPITVMQMGFDGANGVIDIAGTSSGGSPSLLINYYCGKKVFVNTGVNGGDIQLASSGKVGIGIFPESAGPKLDINGDVKIRTLNTPTNNYNVLVADDNGLVGKKTITEIGDGLGNHTATQNIKLGNFWLSNLGDDKGLHIEQSGDLTLLFSGVNSFEIKGSNTVPTRRGIGIPDEAISGQFNFYINPWQTDAAFNFNCHTPAYETTPGNPSTEIPAVTTNLFTILKNGKVGIGTTNPTKNLQVAGNACFGQDPEISAFPLAKVKIYGDGSATQNINWTATHSLVLQGSTTAMSLGVDPVLKKAYISATTTTPDAGTDLILNPQGGNIGIGTNAPIAKLDVAGLVNATGYLLNGLPMEQWVTSGSNIYNNSGNVGIGMDIAYNIQNYKLAVNGSIGAREVFIETDSWPDYVLEKDYSLMTLKELEDYIYKNKHLPNIPSANEIKENGIAVGEMNANLLQKIEELTLYLIKQDKVINEQQLMINELKENIYNIKQIINH